MIMNCYNGEKYISKALDSVLGQLYTNLEVIIWDNQSEDNTAKIISEYTDKRIKYFKAKTHTDLGLARKLAMQKAEGEYIAFLDYDDEWYDFRLSSQIEKMEESDYGFCYAGHDVCDLNEKTLGQYMPRARSGNLFKSLVRNFDIGMVTPLVKSSVLKKHNITFNSHIYAAEEFNLFLRLSLNSRGLAVNQSLGKSRLLPDSLTRTSLKERYEDIEKTIIQLIDENPLIEVSHSRDLDFLRVKALYLKADWLIKSGKITQAKTCIAERKYNFVIYYLIKILSKSYVMWMFLHYILSVKINLRSSKVFRFLTSI